METEHLCKYIKNYSKIGNIQVEHQIVYSVCKKDNGILVQLVHTQNHTQKSVKCFCENLSFEQAKNMLLYFYENSVGVENFQDILQDYNIKFNELTWCVNA